MPDKNFKIWGMSYGLTGDLIMGLPLLTYFEKKYPGSYKYWVIEKKCSSCAPLFFNHPLIDRVKITDEWGGFGTEDRGLIASSNIQTTCEGWKHDRTDWYNIRSCVEETARIAGVKDLCSVLTSEELSPKLYKWFDTGFSSLQHTNYSKKNLGETTFKNNIAIYPFATGDSLKRSPSVAWWKELISKLISLGYTVFHYGRPVEPILSTSKNYSNFTQLSYFDQVKASLASTLCIGTDSGSMWVVGAYSHPAIHLLTNWMPNHHSNFMALAPINTKAVNLFGKNGCSTIGVDTVVKTAGQICQKVR